MIEQCLQIRENILRIAHKNKHGHIPSCFSIVEILYAIYKGMNQRPDDPLWEDRDLFVLSKGHGALAHYCTLAGFGYFDIAEVESLGEHGSAFGCHACRKNIAGIEISTGSLGHGIGVAVGMALAAKIKKSNRRIFALIGDGEANEGSVWESVMVATNLCLPALTVIYDDNLSHGRGLQIPNPARRLEAFGCSATEVDGHDIEALSKALFRAPGNNVNAVVANTQKGFGCPTMINNHYEWHGKAPNDSDFKHLMEELHAQTV